MLYVLLTQLETVVFLEERLDGLKNPTSFEIAALFPTFSLANTMSEKSCNFQLPDFLSPSNDSNRFTFSWLWGAFERVSLKSVQQ